MERRSSSSYFGRASAKQALAEMRSPKDIRLTLRAAAQQATRDLEEATEKAKEAAVRLHDGIRSILGIQSPHLSLRDGGRGFRTRLHQREGFGSWTPRVYAVWASGTRISTDSNGTDTLPSSDRSIRPSSSRRPTSVCTFE